MEYFSRGLTGMSGVKPSSLQHKNLSAGRYRGSWGVAENSEKVQPSPTALGLSPLGSRKCCLSPAQGPSEVSADTEGV